MQLNFQKITIHNFLSYGHAEVDLNTKGYCLVQGINRNLADNAVSNGAGKSSWASALCWCLTGETPHGLTSGVKNINIDENSCWVALDFYADSRHFQITRYKNPKSDLKILLDNQDISGKGLRESEQILAKYLPDLTSQLISSIIILGQGLPNKFTSNTPSGRKEVLEKLSKSDFMIQDLKERLTSRLEELSTALRNTEDTLLRRSTERDMLQQQLEQQEAALRTFECPRPFNQLIQDLIEKKSALDEDIIRNTNLIAEADRKAATLNEQLSELSQRNLTLNTRENAAYTVQHEAEQARILEKDVAIRTLASKINQLKSIKDICPTCGQKLPGVLKPDTSAEEMQLQGLQAELAVLKKAATFTTNEHNRTVNSLSSALENDTRELRFKLHELLEKVTAYKSELSRKQTDVLSLNASLVQLRAERDNFESNRSQCIETISKLQDRLKNIDEEILYIKNEREDTARHVSVVNQLSTLIKRDFRGYLLEDIIKYLALRVREYSERVFGTDALTFALEGNNISIAYCNKAFENLSGGEKQKVDLIVQFALRDMMQQYLGFTSNILVLDEIFDALDQTGCTELLNLISDKFTDLDSVFIISHRATELAIPCDSELIVIKDAQGISTILPQ